MKNKNKQEGDRKERKDRKKEALIIHEKIKNIYDIESQNNIDKIVLYPSVIKTLEEVNQRNLKCVILTNKTKYRAIEIINKFNLKNKNALITGAARLSGIKHSYALLENHCDLVLTEYAFNTNNLNQ